MKTTTKEILAQIRELTNRIDLLEESIGMSFYDYHFVQLRNFLSTIKDEYILKRGQ